jgi:hypothetical protein
MSDFARGPGSAINIRCSKVGIVGGTKSEREIKIVTILRPVRQTGESFAFVIKICTAAILGALYFSGLATLATARQ